MDFYTPHIYGNSLYEKGDIAMQYLWRMKTCLPVAVFFALVFGDAALAQRGTMDATAEGSGVIRIRKITGVGKRGLIQTPEYSTSISRGRTAARFWAEVSVQFDYTGDNPGSSEPEWIDELAFQYYVLLYAPKTKEYTFLKGAVAHIDVAKGRDRVSSMYIRPSGLDRYGEVVVVTVEAVVKGQTVARLTESKLPQGQVLPTEWWKTTKFIPKEGYLLSRDKTPFAFVNYDDYEVVK
jgi:hypothetical protein